MDAKNPMFMPSFIRKHYSWVYLSYLQRITMRKMSALINQFKLLAKFKSFCDSEAETEYQRVKLHPSLETPIYATDLIKLKHFWTALRTVLHLNLFPIFFPRYFISIHFFFLSAVSSLKQINDSLGRLWFGRLK